MTFIISTNLVKFSRMEENHDIYFIPESTRMVGRCYHEHN